MKYNEYIQLTKEYEEKTNKAETIFGEKANLLAVILSDGVILTDNSDIEFNETGCLFHWVDDRYGDYDYVGEAILISEEFLDKDIAEIKQEYYAAIKKKVELDRLAKEANEQKKSKEIYEKEIAELKRLKAKYEE